MLIHGNHSSANSSSASPKAAMNISPKIKSPRACASRPCSRDKVSGAIDIMSLTSLGTMLKSGVNFKFPSRLPNNLCSRDYSGRNTLHSYALQVERGNGVGMECLICFGGDICWKTKGQIVDCYVDQASSLDQAFIVSYLSNLECALSLSLSYLPICC